MPIKIVHIVDNASRVNFGIYNAALFATDYLEKKYNVESFLWICNDKPTEEIELIIDPVYLGNKINVSYLTALLESENISTSNGVFVTHGCWKLPTRLGALLKQLKFKWIYTPHGMLEPWSMSHKKWKKKIFFNLFEKRKAARADNIRAVSRSEQQNLQSLFNKSIELIENGVQLTEYIQKPKGTNVLFMARLHFKKGILPLVLAWTRNMKNAGAKLIIAGPDEGELEKIQPFLNESISYVGSVYGNQKKELLRKCHYYVLPSYSEGFPTSVVEGMGYGLIPLISKGCNFPQVFENGLGYNIEPNEESIAQQLIHIRDLPFDEKLSLKNHQFIKKYNTEEYLGDKLYSMYSKLLNRD